jgi:O-antigen/teichoic acid export membrane protein
MGVKEKALKGGLWLAGFTTISQVISWVSTIGVANFLNPEDYGLMTMASFLTAYIEYLSEMGIGASVIQKNDINHKELSSLFWLSIFSGCICSLIALGTVYPTALIFHDKRIIPVTLLIIPIFLIGSVASIPNAILRRDLQLKYIGISNIVAAIVSCSCQIIFASKGLGVYTLILGLIILRTVKTICICCFAKWIPLFHYSFLEIKPYLKFGINMAGGALLFRIFQTVDSFIVGNRFNATLLGNYNFSSSLASMPTDKIWPIFQQTLFPLLSRLQHDKKDKNRTLLSTLEYCACFTFPLYLAGFFLAHDLIIGLLGAKWLPIVPFFKVFCIVRLVELLTNFCNLLFNTSGKAKETLIFSVLRVIIMPVSIFCASFFGYNYIILPWATIYPLLCIIWLLYTLSYYEIKISAFLLILYKPVLLSGIFITSCFIVRIALNYYRANFQDERVFVGSYLTISGIICLIYLAIFEQKLIIRSFKNKKA